MDDETTVRDVDRARREAMIAADVATLEKLFALWASTRSSCGNGWPASSTC